MASLVASTVEDQDLDTRKELNKLFANKFSVQIEKSATDYILFIAQNKSQLVAAGLSGRPAVVLYDAASGLRETGTINLKEEKKTGQICGVKCSTTNDNELFVGSSIGEVHLYDIRTNDLVNKFWDSETSLKPYTAFDVNSNGRVICVGTEETKTDVFLSFFDVRQKKMIGGYWESHEKDISQVKFHPTNPNSLASGSIDGLINTFDISQINEDEALQCTFNTDRSVASLNWHKDDLISCITDSNELMFYDVQEMELVQEFSRATITERMRRNCSMECGLIDCHNIGGRGGERDQIAVMATSNFENGECLRTLTYDAASKSLQPHGNFTGNRQIVRCSYYNDTDNYFLTGGEHGLITLWRSSGEEGGSGNVVPSDTVVDVPIDSSEVGKAKKKKHSKAHKNKPY